MPHIDKIVESHIGKRLDESTNLGSAFIKELERHVKPTPVKVISNDSDDELFKIEFKVGKSHTFRLLHDAGPTWKGPKATSFYGFFYNGKDITKEMDAMGYGGSDSNELARLITHVITSR